MNKVGEIEGEIRVLGKVVLAQRNPSPQSKLRGGAPVFGIQLSTLIRISS